MTTSSGKSETEGPSAYEELTAVSPLALASVLLRNSRSIVGLPAAVFVLATALSILRPTRYTAESRFAPQVSQTSTSRLGALGARLGISLGGAQATETMEYYGELLRSREVLREAALTRYAYVVEPNRRDSVRASLLDLYRARGKTQEERLNSSMDRLKRDIYVLLDNKSGLVTVRVTQTDPALAVLVNRRLVSLVNEFNLSKRRLQAHAEREFVEGRMRDAQRELEAAEAVYQRFLVRNRSYQSSPDLTFEAGRMQRRVDLNQQLYLSLAGAADQARMEEARDTPVITVIDDPVGGVTRAGRGLVLNGLIALIVGATLAAGLAVTREYVMQQRGANPSEYEELGLEWRRFREGLRPANLLRRRNAAGRQR